MMEKAFLLGKDAKQLWTREKAKKIRGEVEEMLETLQPGDTLVIDAKGVEVFDYSFANELFGKLVIGLPKDHPGRFLIVEHLSTYTRENLAKALESLNLIMIERRTGKPALLGKVHPADQATFEAITRTRGAVTSAELSGQLGTNLTAMNERLTKLCGLALVRRQKSASRAGREQYEYRSLS